MTLWFLVILSITTDLLEGLVSVGDFYLSPMRILTLVLTAHVTFVLATTNRRSTVRAGPVMRTFMVLSLVFLMLVVVSALGSPDIWYSVKRTLNLFSLFALAWTAYYLAAWNRWRADSMMSAWQATGLVVCVLGVIQGALGISYGGKMLELGTRSLLGLTVWRVSSVFKDPNFFGFFLLSFVPLAILRPFRRPAGASKVLLLGLGLVCIVLTASRGTMLALAAAAIATFAFGARFARRVRAGLVVVLGAALVWGYQVATSEEFAAKLSDLDNRDASMSSRSYIWQTGLRLIEDNPWVGVGPGNFVKVEKGRFLRELPRDQQEIYSSIAGHSNYIEIAAESGVFALLAYLSIFAYVLRCLLLRMATGDLADRQAFRWIAFSLGAWLIANAFLSYYPFFTFLLIGFGMQLCERHPEAPL